MIQMAFTLSKMMGLFQHETVCSEDFIAGEWAIELGW